MKRSLARLSMACLLAAGIAAFASPDQAAHAATVRQITASCSAATVSGSVAKYAPYVRITVALASDLSQTIARVYTRVRPGKSYRQTFPYQSPQPDGTNLIFAVCESNGRQCLRQAVMVSAVCQSDSASPTPPPTTAPTSVPTSVPTLPPTPTELPTTVPTLPPTATPVEPPTMVPPTATPTPIEPPTATPVPAFCTTPTTIVATCSWMRVSGCVTMTAPWVRVTAWTAAYPITQIGEAVGLVQPDGSYSVTVSYPAQPEGTHLLGSYGEWDGSWWLRPATLFGADCSG
jgi:hypothetical protein